MTVHTCAHSKMPQHNIVNNDTEGRGHTADSQIIVVIVFLYCFVRYLLQRSILVTTLFLISYYRSMYRSQYKHGALHISSVPTFTL